MDENNQNIDYKKFFDEKNINKFSYTEIENSNLSEEVKQILKEEYPYMKNFSQILHFQKKDIFRDVIGTKNYAKLFDYFYENGIFLQPFFKSEKIRTKKVYAEMSKTNVENYKKEKIENLPLSNSAKKAISLFKESNENSYGYHDKIKTVSDLVNMENSIFYGKIGRVMPNELDSIEYEINSLLAVRGLGLKNSKFTIFDLNLEDLNLSSDVLKLFKEQNLHYISSIIHRSTLKNESLYEPYFENISKALENIGLEFGKQSFYVYHNNVLNFDKKRMRKIQKIQDKKFPVHFENSNSYSFPNKKPNISIKTIPNSNVPNADFTIKQNNNVTFSKPTPQEQKIKTEIPTTSNKLSINEQIKLKQAYDFLESAINDTNLPERLKQNLTEHFPNAKTVAQVVSFNKNNELSSILSYQNFNIFKAFLLNHGIDLDVEEHKYPYKINTSSMHLNNLKGENYLSLEIEKSDLPDVIKIHFKEDMPEIKTLGEAIKPEKNKEVKTKLKNLYFIYKDIVSSHDIKIENLSRGTKKLYYENKKYENLSTAQYLNLSIQESDLPEKIKKDLKENAPEIKIIKDIIDFEDKILLRVSVLNNYSYSILKNVLKSHGVDTNFSKKYIEYENNFTYSKEEYDNMTKYQYLSLPIADSDLPSQIIKRLNLKLPECKIINDIINDKGKTKSTLGNEPYYKIKSIVESHGIDMSGKAKYYLDLPESKFSKFELRNMSTEQYLNLNIVDSDLTDNIKIKFLKRMPKIKTINDILECGKSTIRDTVLGLPDFSKMSNIFNIHGIEFKQNKYNDSYYTKKTLTFPEEEYKNMPLENYLALSIDESDFTDIIKERINKKAPDIKTINDIVTSKNKTFLRNSALGQRPYLDMAEILRSHGIEIKQKQIKNSSKNNNGQEYLSDSESENYDFSNLSNDEIIKILTERLLENGLSEIKELPLECFDKNSESVKQIIKSFDNYAESKIKNLEKLNDFNEIEAISQTLVSEISEFDEILSSKEEEFEKTFNLQNKREEISKTLRKSIHDLYDKFLHDLPSSEILSQYGKVKVHYFNNSPSSLKIDEENELEEIEPSNE